MGCFGCFAPEADEDLRPSKHDDSSGADARRKVAPDVASGYAHSFTFKDLLVATGYFNEANFIGEGGFGKVYKGKINGQTILRSKDTAGWRYGFTALFLSVRSLEFFQGMECIWSFSSMLNGSDSVISFYHPLFVDPSIH
ncbi:hypothetical protein ZEAMMB73_Zm00001d049664 [Zea mays]|uniref:Uncharacterized protein n=2 Tax=Zea mays TaxID=4577 RepID=A0A1D6PWX2_MAIZE|nr:hypothetical protein ZEAMMB73_Zm00001d049664 [Zea mays]